MESMERLSEAKIYKSIKPELRNGNVNDSSTEIFESVAWSLFAVKARDCKCWLIFVL